MRLASPLYVALLATCALVACGGQPAPPASPPTAAASQEATTRVGDVTVRASALQGSALNAQVAAQYGLPRDPGTVVLLVGVRQGDEASEVAVPATVTATATDLRGRQHAIELRQQRTGDLIDYVGTVPVSAPDTLRFDVRVVRAGGGDSTLQFSREFYPR